VAPSVRQLCRFILHVLVLCAVTVAVGVALYLKAPRFPSADPASADFEAQLGRLCELRGVARRPWRYIVIHHSATLSGSAAAFDRYHVTSRGWQSLGYHFVIGNGTQTADGEVEAGPRWMAQQPGAHAGVAEQNEYGIGVCLVGDFTSRRPTALQMRSLEALVLCLSATFGIGAENVIGHRECPGAATDCPGAGLNMDELRRSLASRTARRLE
jgi:N-acetyl-anhydromuramyl-L-alanine amidase AmpD